MNKCSRNKKIRNYELKIFFHNNLNLLVLLISYSFLFSYLILEIYTVAQYGYVNYESILKLLRRLSYFHFFIIFLLSINYFSLLEKVGLKEAVQTGNMKRMEKNQFFILFSINALVITGLILYGAISFFALCCGNGINWRAFWLVMLTILVDYGLVGMTAVYFGNLLSKIPEKKARLLLFLFLNIVIGYPLYWLCDYMISVPRGSVRAILLEAVALLPEGLNVTSDGYASYPVQPHRIALILTWLSALYSLHQLYYYKKREKTEKTGLIAGIIITAVMLFVTIQPYTPVKQGQRAQSYYGQKWEEIRGGVIGRRDEAADFNVTAYEMEFSAILNLRARIHMFIDRQDLSEYRFTLYREYGIANILDQNGNSLSYERDGDYLSVYAGEDPVSEIYMEYSGSGAPFVSDLSAIHLPSGFAFYPMAGYHPIYRTYMEGFTAYNRIHLPVTTKYDVTMHTLGPVYSSLERMEGNTFRGTSDGFFLFAGMVEEDVVDGVTFYYPSVYPLDGDMDAWRTGEAEFITQLNEIYDDYEELDSVKEGQTIVMNWEIMNLFSVSDVFKDHINVIYFLARDGYGNNFREFYDFDYK